MFASSCANAHQLAGMPPSHAQQFQNVANQTKCVIACRSVGKYATGLIEEGYASKGFHIKAKSCNWGPMAGFVLSDPRFTKRGMSTSALTAQRTDVHKALNATGQGFRAGETPVYISDDRRRALEAMGCMQRVLGLGDINSMIYTARPAGGSAMRFELRREPGAGGAIGFMPWAVYYGAGEVAMPSSPTALNTPSAKEPILPVMALTNPNCAFAGTYRSAVTGDYDLWGVFPEAIAFNPRNDDRRMVPGSDRFSVPMRTFAAYENPHLGNGTPRVLRIQALLNTAIRSAGYNGGDMVHHSDEVGRPLVSEVELEFIAFVPGEQQACFVRNTFHLNDFIRGVVKTYHVPLNPGWGRQLGFGATNRGSWEV